MEREESNLKDSMQLVKNMWALSQGLVGLDDWTVLHILKTNSENTNGSNITKKTNNAIALSM